DRVGPLPDREGASSAAQAVAVPLPLPAPLRPPHLRLQKRTKFAISVRSRVVTALTVPAHGRGRCRIPELAIRRPLPGRPTQLRLRTWPSSAPQAVPDHLAAVELDLGALPRLARLPQLPTLCAEVVEPVLVA